MRVLWYFVVVLAALSLPWISQHAIAPPLPGGSSATASVQVSPGVQALYRLESSNNVFDVSYRYGQAAAAPDGAYGPNVTAPPSAWFIEYQRAGAIDVIDGALRGDPTLISQGLRIFRFGLSREAATGAFPGSAWPFHGSALFLSEAAPALLVLEASKFSGQFASEMNWQAKMMRRAAYYMVRWVGGPPRIDDSTKNHRCFEAAIALGATAVLTQDPTLKRWSARYAARGIAMERGTGVMPEDGGHDSGYQALGLTSASRYLVLVASGTLRSHLRSALVRAETWELSRVGSSGAIDQRGDTRTAHCRERDPLGHCKTIFYAPIFGALARWATITGDSRFARASLLVWQRSEYGAPPP